LEIGEKSLNFLIIIAPIVFDLLSSEKKERERNCGGEIS
jgi:hypothetical protein